MGPVRIGVLGCAGIARKRMLPAFDASSDVRLVGLASRRPAEAAPVAERYGCRLVPRYEDLLAAEDVDAVYVPLPAALHERWVHAALLLGKHVLAEKPMAATAAGTARLLDLAAARGLALMENVMFVHHGQHRAVRELVAAGEIGELRQLRATFTVPRLDPADIRYRPELGGGALADTGVYPIRAALTLLGDELRVAGAVLERTGGFTVDTAGAALLRGPGGVAVQLFFGLDHAYRNEYELSGDRGRLVLEQAFTPGPEHRPVLRLVTADGVRESVLPAEDQVAATVRAFVAAVRGAPVDGAACLAQARLLDEIRACAAKDSG